jgi:hypothetical protein
MLSLVNAAHISVFNVAELSGEGYVVGEHEPVYLGGEAIG